MKGVNNMRYKYLIPTLCIFGTMPVHADGGGLSGILQQVGEKEKLIKPESQKKLPNKKSRFVFHDEYDSNGIGSKEKSDKSETYDYDNKSRFKFKFNDGMERSNFVGGTSMGGISGGQGAGSGSGGGRR